MGRSAEQEADSPSGSAPDLDSILATFGRLAELKSGPIPVIVDTSGLRTGLDLQVRRGRLPACLWCADRGEMRLFMEGETFDEAQALLPRFADQLGVPEGDVAELFCREWAPRIRRLSLPPALRAVDPRASEVQARDATDFASAALAALLSPCVLLTSDKDFAALGVRDRRQGSDAIVAAIGVRAGESTMSAVTTVPIMPAAGLVTGIKMAADRFSAPFVGVILTVILIGAVLLYRVQPPERKQRICDGAATAGRFYLEIAAQAAEELAVAEAQLYASAIPGSIERTPIAAVLRRLATAPESMSAAQIAESLDFDVRPSVAALRAYLHANKVDLFVEVRRGGFELGYPAR